VYPPRINKSGVMEKRKKKPARIKFESLNLSKEMVYDLVAWIKKDVDLRATSEASGGFYSPPPDLVVFLNQEKWTDEIGVVVTKAQRKEKNRRKSVLLGNIKSYISQFENIIHEWTVQELLHHKQFRYACDAYPKVKAWALEQRPELKGAKPDKADNPPYPPPVKPKILPKAENPTPNPTSDANLPPPDDPVRAAMLKKFTKEYDLF